MNRDNPACRIGAALERAGIAPGSGHNYGDTKRYIDATPNLDDGQRAQVYEGNARRVFSRLKI